MPLSNVRAIEVCSGVPAAYCGRLLADLGAEIKLVGIPQQPELNPSGSDVLSTGLWRALHRNKTHIGQLPASTTDWQPLLEWCDLLIIEGGPTEIAALRLPTPLPKHVVLVAVSHFGQTGTRAEWRGSDLVDVAYGGGCNKNGEPGRPPLRPPAFMSAHEVGLNAAIAALLALRAQRRDGIGQIVDVSAVDSWATIQTGIGLLEFIFMGRLEQRLGRAFAGRGYPYTMLPCKDGYIRLIAIQGREWARAIEMMGNPEWANNPRYANRIVNQEKYADELDKLVGSWLADRTMNEVLDLALKHNVPWAPVQTLVEVLEDRQLKSRQYWWNCEGVRLPGFPAIFSRTRARFRNPAPTVAHERRAFAESTVPSRQPTGASPGHAAGAPPLAGLRVLDFGWAWAGAVPGAVMADFGADVVKIESSQRLDPMRMDRPLVGTAPDREQGSLHNNINRNKRSIEIDLQSAEGIKTVHGLVAQSDVLIENLSTGSLDRLGLSYEVLSKINPRLIYVSIGAVGRTGPIKDLRSYAPVLTAISGADAAVGYVGEQILGLQHGFADPNAGLHAAFATLAALNERELSGKGQYIDVSQFESMVSLSGGQLVALQQGIDIGKPMGNRDNFMAPHGIYPVAGDDRWIAIACEDDRAWSKLVEILGSPEWAKNPALATLKGRLEAQDRIDANIEQWTRSKDGWDIANELQAAGIAAAPLLTSEDRVSDEHLASREAFAMVDHAVVGGELIYGIPWKLSRTPGVVRSAAPLLGQHTADVLHEFLGVAEPMNPVNSEDRSKR